MTKKRSEPIDPKESPIKPSLPPVEESKELFEDPQKESPSDIPFTKEELFVKPDQINEEILIGEAKLRATLAEPAAEISINERIISFLKSRNASGFVRVNDFLKSLYPISKNNEPVEWQQQATMKTLRAILHGMVVGRQISFSTNAYEQLGKPYWPDDTTGKTHYHHLGSLVIEAKLL